MPQASARTHSRKSPHRAMRLPSVLALVLLAAAALPGLAQRPAADQIVPGNLSLALAPAEGSTLGLDLADVEAVLCGRRGGLGTCGLPVSKDVLDPIVLGITQVVLDKDGEGAAAAAVPQSFHLTGPLLETICGRWRYWVLLDPQTSQATSWIDLHPPVSPFDMTAPFSTTLDFAVRMYFESETEARTVEVPMTLSLELSGEWTVILPDAPERASSIDQGNTNLVLLAKHYGGTWIPAPTVATGTASYLGVTAGRCGHRLGLQAPPEAILALTGGRKGMSWGKLAHHTAWGVDHVGCQGCDAYTGDTACSLPLPLLCLHPDGSPPPPGLPIDFYNGWAGGNIGLTAPVRGDQLGSPAQADALCQITFGPGYRMAEFHDGGGGWSWYSRGNVDASTRFWVHILDQPANCWNP